MINQDGIIINSPHHLSPIYRISPFKEEHIIENKRIYNSTPSDDIFNYFDKLFPSKSIQLTLDGRSAISHAIDMLGLKGSDCVTIVTTTDNFYISSCVTKEIEKKCLWSRDINPNTKAIFINHEFGMLDRRVKEFKKLGIPIIEDFAHSFCSLEESSKSEYQGDLLVCSFSKIFPMQAGGAILFDERYSLSHYYNSKMLDYVNSNASFYIQSLEDIKRKRLKNYEIFLRKFQSIGVIPFFKFSKTEVPGVFCFNLRENINSSEFKEFMNANGIESSVFYGKNAYFVPCHQGMNEGDIDYVFEVASYFLEK